MLTHRTRAVVPENRELTLRLPPDIRPGDVEIIILAAEPKNGSAGANADRLAFEARFPRDARLGPIEFHEDPTAPLAEEDWPDALRPPASP